MPHLPSKPVLVASSSAACREAYAYLQALEQAAEAIQTARRLRTDSGLDHALDRLRMLLIEAHQQLIEAEQAAAMPSS